jgi:hypothetical protein
MPAHPWVNSSWRKAANCPLRVRAWVIAAWACTLDDFAESPISALRCISKSLRRTGVRLTPRDLRALKFNFFRNRLVFEFFPVHHKVISIFLFAIHKE